MSKHCINCDFVLPTSHKTNCPYCGLSPDVKGQESKWAAFSANPEFDMTAFAPKSPRLTLIDEGKTTFSRVNSPVGSLTQAQNHFSVVNPRFTSRDYKRPSRGSAGYSKGVFVLLVFGLSLCFFMTLKYV